MPDAPFSGRAHISKGFLKEARNLAERNVAMFHLLAREDRPLLGIEPSAILGFRDEFPRLLRGVWQEKARELSQHALLIEEFLIRELRAGRIGSQDFPGDPKHILLHGHCHQKALADFEALVELLSLPEQNHVEVIPSGCCGMAGSFGYEKEHYELSMKIGELVLFPAVRNARPGQVVVAPGTSCRHQILDGTGQKALHPVEVL
jgi:Fe-S oxidoreductase